MERPVEGEYEDLFTRSSESELFGAGRGGCAEIGRGAEGLTASPKISGSPSPTAAAGAGKFMLDL